MAKLTYDALMVRLPFIVAYWSMNDTSNPPTTMTDSMRLYDGVYVGSPGVGVNGGLTDDTSPAVQFFGTMTATSIDRPGLNPVDGVAMSVWANFGLGSSIVIMGKANQYVMRVKADSALEVSIYSGGKQAATSAAGVVKAGWHHFAMAYDKTTLSGYYDGALVASAAVTGVIATTAAPVTIGSLASAEYVQGRIHKAAVFSRPLSARQVLQQFTLGRKILPDPQRVKQYDPLTTLSF